MKGFKELGFTLVYKGNDIEDGIESVNLLKIRFQMIANISEKLIGQLQVTQRD
jgi:hypothetical protein